MVKPPDLPVEPIQAPTASAHLTATGAAALQPGWMLGQNEATVSLPKGSLQKAMGFLSKGASEVNDIK